MILLGCTADEVLAGSLPALRGFLVVPKDGLAGTWDIYFSGSASTAIETALHMLNTVPGFKVNAGEAKLSSYMLTNLLGEIARQHAADDWHKHYSGFMYRVSNGVAVEWIHFDATEGPHTIHFTSVFDWHDSREDCPRVSGVVLSNGKTIAASSSIDGITLVAVTIGQIPWLKRTESI